MHAQIVHGNNVGTSRDLKTSLCTTDKETNVFIVITSNQTTTILKNAVVDEK